MNENIKEALVYSYYTCTIFFLSWISLQILITGRSPRLWFLLFLIGALLVNIIIRIKEKSQVKSFS
ncbi:Uncharacterised protein [Mycobacterium tuberculosis]|nr:Uncharacterised protein [Mycobacterium tuberculosis]